MILFLQEEKGAFSNAPYCDAHGEPDPGLRRGKPLSLNLKKYENWQNLWVSHKVCHHKKEGGRGREQNVSTNSFPIASYHSFSQG